MSGRLSELNLYSRILIRAPVCSHNATSRRTSFHIARAKLLNSKADCCLRTAPDRAAHCTFVCVFVLAAERDLGPACLLVAEKKRRLANGLPSAPPTRARPSVDESIEALVLIQRKQARLYRGQLPVASCPKSRSRRPAQMQRTLAARRKRRARAEATWSSRRRSLKAFAKLD